MAITFARCRGKNVRDRDDLAGRKTRCPVLRGCPEDPQAAQAKVFAANGQFVRFVFCVARLAIGTAAVRIALAGRVVEDGEVNDSVGFHSFMFQVLGVPMVLHGSYHTFPKQDMNALTLGVAALSCGWLAFQVENVRGGASQVPTMQHSPQKFFAGYPSRCLGVRLRSQVWHDFARSKNC